MRQIPFAARIVGDIAESMLFLPLDLLGLAWLGIRLELRHEPDRIASLALAGVGMVFLLMLYGPTLAAAFYPFAWFQRMWRHLFGYAHNSTREARERAIRSANQLRYTAQMISDRAHEDTK